MRETFENIELEAVKDPMKVAAASMRDVLPKRFYQKVEVEEGAGAFSVKLDGRAVKTPSRNPFLLPSRQVAQIAAAEWDAQEERIDPTSMPLTRLANTAIDGVARDMQAVKEDIIRFASSDLICYRADQPQGLVMLQQRHWDPLIDWAAGTLSARFILAEGIIHVAQPAEAMAAFGVYVGAIDDAMVLASVHTLTSITGSAVIGMAVWKEFIDADAAWLAAHVDEDWQISQWGEDFEAVQRRNVRRAELDASVSLLGL